MYQELKGDVQKRELSEQGRVTKLKDYAWCDFRYPWRFDRELGVRVYDFCDPVSRTRLRVETVSLVDTLTPVH